MPINDPKALLRRLLKEPAECGWLEFKRNNADPETIGSWISACANAAILEGKERAFIVFGVEDTTKRVVGTKVVLSELKKGGENIINWLSRVVEPRMMMEFVDFRTEGHPVAILAVEPTYDRPVKFSGFEYIRIGENIKRLHEFPDHERALWIATGRRKFENAIAITHQSPQQVVDLLDVDAFYGLIQEPKPSNQNEVTRKLEAHGLLVDDLEDGFDITNLGAILLARRLQDFRSLEGKSIRLIRYIGKDKRQSDNEIEIKHGYAVEFGGFMKMIMGLLPRKEMYTHGIRTLITVYPEVAVREVLANALIHQDFTVSGAGPVIEIYDGRVEVTNPGNSLIEVDRLIDERRSRNEKLASVMRMLGLCEERGGGLDKALFAIEERNLPAPEFHSSSHSMRVVLYGPRALNELSKAEKMRACFYHCILRWLQNDFMSNTSLRARFMLEQEDYQIASAIISEALRAKRIIPAEIGQGKRNARYVPYWVRKG